MVKINTRGVKAWMVRQGLTQCDVARAAGVCQQMVSKYLNGERNSERLTAFFVSGGCPKRYLPNNMEQHYSATQKAA